MLDSRTNLKLYQGSEESLPLFSWVITESCNYKCSYCIEKSTFSNEVKLDFSIFLNVINSLKKIDYDFNVEIMGGELTLIERNKLLLIIKKILEIRNIKDMSFITNGSADEEYYKFIFNNIKDERFYFIVSYHPTQVKLDNFIEKIINLKHCRFYPSFNITSVFSQNLFNSIKLIKENNIPYFINILTKKNGEIFNYPEETIKKYKDVIDTSHSFRFDGVPFKENSTYGMLFNNKNQGNYCIPKFIDISPEGVIYNKCRNDNLIYSNTPIRCFREGCECYQMINYPKYKEV